MAPSSDAITTVGHTDRVLDNIQRLLLSIESTESNYQAFVLADRDCIRDAA
jgi:hypothetical protein